MNDLLNYISEPQNAEYNFALGLWYEDQGHTAAAAGFYVRTAEYAANDVLSYEALLRLSNCFTRLGSRTHLNKGILLRAISFMPDRPEAYFLISKIYEQNKDWEESYSFAVMGQKVNESYYKLRTNVDYPGKYALVFQQAVAAWWIGLFSESLHLFRELDKDPTMLPIHIIAVKNNLKNLDGTVPFDSLSYDKQIYENLRVKFPGARDIEQNYSQAYQDMFVLTMLNGKRNSSFFEIGCGDPEFRNNTKLLEEFGWTGTSIDIDPKLTEKWKERKSKVITGDATKLDYNALIDKDYGYLQIDTDPASISMAVLLKIPFEKHRFSVITFEHDAYHGVDIRDRSRQYLQSQGYVLIAGDIAYNRHDSFEDWWVHPDLVDAAIIEKMQNRSQAIKKADCYMLRN